MNDRDWQKGYYPGQNKLGEIIMKVREEIRPLFQPAIIPHPDCLSHAESLALATSNKAAHIPVPSPRVVEQMIQHPSAPPTTDRAKVLSYESRPNPDHNIKTLAASITPTMVPPLPMNCVDSPRQDTERNPDVDTGNFNS